MLLGLEIGMIIVGILALVTGKIKLSKNRVATGVVARFAGFIFLLPIPVALGVLVFLSFLRASEGKPVDSSDWKLTSSLIEFGICVAFAILGFVMALTAAGPAEPSAPRCRKKDEEMSTATTGATEEPILVFPVEEATPGFRSESPNPVPPIQAPALEARRPAVKRSPVERSSSSGVVWWVLGGAAVCFFLCIIPIAGGIVWWLFSSSSSPQSTPQSTVAVDDRFPDPNNQLPQRKEDWAEQQQKMPQIELPPGAGGPGLPGNIQPPGQMPDIFGKPPEPPFKPIVIPQPAAQHLDIKPPKLDGERVVRKLPSTVNDAAVGGGGRFLILHLAPRHKLAIFDVNEAKIVKYLSFTDDIKFAAGMDKLLVALPDKKILQRWSLTTFERELTVPLAGQGKVQLMEMGSASNGPLVIRQAEQGFGGVQALSFYDIRTMKPLDVKWANNNMVAPVDARTIRASANGKVFGVLSWGPAALLWDDGKITITNLLQGGGQYVLPGPDGKTIFTENAIFTEQLKPAAGAANVKGAMPATHGRYYIAGNSVYLLGDSRPLMTFPAEKPDANMNDPARLIQMMQQGQDGLALDKRGYFIPDAKLLVFIPFSNDQLVLRRLDVEEGLEKSGIDYLFVTSVAPSKAKRGATYRYQLAVKSKKGGVKYHVESGPKEMKVSRTGLVTWDVPKVIAESEVDVIMTISDQSGQEVFHNFRVLPGEQGEEQVVAKADVPAQPAKPDEKKPDIGKVEEPEPEPQPRAERPILPPVRPAPALRPPKLEADKVVKPLPSAIADVVVGGGGRFLILHLPEQRKLAVFDVNEGKVVRYLPLTADNVKLAAGRDKLIVAIGGDNVLQRWSLTTFQREVTAPLPVQFKLSAIAMGSNSDGPLLVASADGASRPEMFFMDIITLKKLPIEKTGQGHIHIMEGDSVRASADGRVFALWSNNHTPAGIQTLLLEGRDARGFYEHSEVGHLTPGPDGKVLYTGAGRYSNQVKPLGDHSPGAPFCLPAVQGDYYLTVKPNGAEQARDRRRRGIQLTAEKNLRGTIAVHRVDDERALVTLTDMDLPGDIHLKAFNKATLPADKRIYFFPTANLLVTIPDANDRLVLHRLDIEKALEKSGIDFLFVTSQPPARAKRGDTYRYQVQVKSKKGGVYYRVESGPKGMKVSDKGLVTWDVPRSFFEPLVDVILVVGDKSGQEIFHNFPITPSDRLDEPAAPAPADIPPEPAKQPEQQSQAPAVKPLLPPIQPAPFVPPPNLASDRIVKALPSTIADCAVGGGGRYLILHLPQQRKLAVFDVSLAKVKGYVPLASDFVRFAAGREKLMVAYGDTKIIQRWNPATLQREATARLDIMGYKLNEIAMGSASDGPLWVIASAPQANQTMSLLMDIATFKNIPLQWTGESFFIVQENGNIRVSANGRLFAVWLSNSSPQGVQTFVMQGNEARGYRKHETAGHLLPDADGKMIYTMYRPYTSQTLPVGEMPKKRRFCLPATQPGYYMDIEGDTITNLTQKSDGTVVVYLAGNEKPLAKLPDIDLPRLTLMAARDRLTGDKRIHFIPSAKVIVTIPDASDRVVLQRFDVEEALEKSGIDYLFVASQPPFKAKKGAPYRYQLAVKSKKGGVKYGVESGPTEMKISDTGLVTWDVPRSFAESQVDVILTISDKSGQEIFHTFHIVPGDEGEEQNAAAADIPKEPVKSDDIKEKPQPAKQPEPVQPQPGAAPPKESGVRELRSMRISRNSYVHALTFTPDSRELLSAGDDGRLRRWSVADGRELSSSFDPHPRVTMFSVGLSADGKWMVTSGLDKTAKVWETATDKLRTTCTHTDRIPHVRAALSPDGKIVATATNQVHLWDAETGHELELLKTPLGAVDALVFSPDGKRLAFGGSRNTVKVWDVAERKELASLTGHTRLITGLAFAPDGKTLASASVDRTIKLWNLETNKERLTLTGHAEALSSVAFSPDGKLLLSGAGATRVEPSRRGEVKLWDAATGQLLTDLRGHTDGVSSVAFAPEGKTVAAAGRDHTVRLWDVSAHAKGRPAAGDETPKK